VYGPCWLGSHHGWVKGHFSTIQDFDEWYGIKMPKELPMKTQERAYTSPIWYTP